MSDDIITESQPCRLGYQEYDGTRYCFEHWDFIQPGSPFQSICPTSLAEMRRQ